MDRYIKKAAGMLVFALAAFILWKGAAAVLPGAVTVSSSVNGKMLPISSVATEKKQVALTFDAAYGNGDVTKILEILKKNEVQATFFVTGQWVEEYPDEVKEILYGSHDLGNGSDSHRNMAQMNGGERLEEIQQAHTKVQALTGYEMFLFRPPYGDYDNGVVDDAAECGYYSIGWNVDSLDWKDYGVDSILDNVLKSGNLKNGSIILCHSGAKYTPKALEPLIRGLKEQGFAIVPVSQLIYREKYHMDSDGRQVKNGK